MFFWGSAWASFDVRDVAAGAVPIEITEVAWLRLIGALDRACVWIASVRLSKSVICRLQERSPELTAGCVGLRERRRAAERGVKTG